MSDAQSIDTRGLSCPHPAMLARQAMQKTGKGKLEILVDTETAHQNITRLAENAGWSVSSEEQPDGITKLVLTK